ncbi:FKBP-type peptidyl-prolyl cis-trans isomerase [Mangrovitalea sediminis]|uniref:FKBP-type peptidyl-prolyl cis-trans isomerase n=1 Tax=Mangrovitalea sediminis TaxID=1982043 RepID=UPI000BE5ECDA|nr:peptidylprolyl isomerase [Mangrovitalea sediminis]
MREPRVFALNYWLKNRKGEVVDTSEGGEPLRFVEGAGQVVEGLERAVRDRAVGDRLEVTIPPELAYGEHRDELVRAVPRSLFQGVDELAVGMTFQTNTGDDRQVVKVVEVRGDMVRVDANHPLAGFTLYFDLEVLEVRDATPDEVASGMPQ